MDGKALGLAGLRGTEECSDSQTAEMAQVGHAEKAQQGGEVRCGKQGGEMGERLQERR